MYTLYVGNFDKATETLSTWMKKSPAMTAVIEEIQVEGVFIIARSVKLEDTMEVYSFGGLNLR